ncbi:polysaccharide biosynthesis/export family protein [Antarcticirhabdus aurantiaca]|uniref:Polysaccharide biosynthesis/export family protein n=1 Tax=Antarcticirhabdus aurantiaca TaxID=2606717 RepID=A0ACD4NM25_9HYPH|nr:polysaccharide biosynthesis/export family protein [Antarcticirhabdus aurantiaca]WAJ27945.1 polysaccharide biosynthesis/export family protein [Jeongeuplla avenae]
MIGHEIDPARSSRRSPGGHGPAGRLALAALCLLVAGAPTGFARAASPVAPGDVIRVSVSEAPDLNREAPVDADGRIMLPQVGGIEVAGLDLDGARARIQEAIAGRGLVRVPTVLVEIASYRPFYVGGMVANPGSVPFSPGLTVRHAIILAGGLDRTRGAEPMSATDLLDLRARWEGNAVSLLQVESRIARLRAELDDLKAPDFSEIEAATTAPDETQAIVDLETGQFADRVKQSESSRDHLENGLVLADLEIDILGKQADLEQNEEAIQAAQIEKARTLLAKGLVPESRLQELERQRSQISRDLLDNRAFAARARQGKETIRYELDVVEAKRRVEVRGELVEAIGQRAKLRAESGVLAGALLAAGIAITDPDASELAEPTVTLHRIVDGKETVLAAAMDTAIDPGDVVQVTIAPRPRR